jgi:hypothetical protein
MFLVGRIFRLGHLEPRSDDIEATGEIFLAQQPAAQHDVSQSQQLLLGRGRSAVHGLTELILSVAPLQRRESGTGRETLARRVKANLPGRIRVGHAVARCELFPGLILASDGLEQWDR